MYSICLALAFSGAEPAFHERHVLHARGAGCNGTRVREAHHIRGRSAGCGGNQARASGCTGGYQRSAPAICPCPAPQAMPRAMQGSACPTCPGGVCAVVTATVGQTPANSAVIAVLDAHNRVRAANGLGPVELDAELCIAAQAQSQRQASAGQIHHSHDNAYENCSWNSDDPTGSWMRSTVGHKDNVLSRAITRIGFGMAMGNGTIKTPKGVYRAYGPYWTSQAK